MSPNPKPPTVQGVVASLLWLAAHPDRRLCLHHQMQMLMQMRYLASTQDEVEPLLRTVAHQLAEELDKHVREQITEREEEAPPQTWIN